MIRWLRKFVGLDGAIAYTVLARGFQIVGSSGTVLLIARFLTPVEQGYYYTLLSLTTLAAVFELGFSLVILQLAAHERAHLSIDEKGAILGDPVRHARLASILQKTLRWYVAAGAMFLAAVWPSGLLLLSRRIQDGTATHWHGPWMFAVAATAVLFILNPVLSFLEGCGQVRQVAQMRFFQGLMAVLVPWTVLIAHLGLWAPGAVNAAYALIVGAFLFLRRALLLPLLRHQTNRGAISWGTEIWPFQWMLAVSSICTWLTAQAFTPAIFAARGPVEAGRMGMSMSIANYLSVLALPWMSTKAAPFGTLIARGKVMELDRLFLRTLRQSFMVFAIAATLCMACIASLNRWHLAISGRMAPPQLFAILFLSSGGAFLVQSLAVYLRAFKREPFLGQSIAVSLLTVCGLLVCVRQWGMNGAAIVYFLCTGLTGPVIAIVIFLRSRRMRRHLYPPVSYEYAHESWTI